jgi:hypothetical protein
MEKAGCMTDVAMNAKETVVSVWRGDVCNGLINLEGLIAYNFPTTGLLNDKPDDT